MNLAGEPISTDEYFVTAHQIFDCCGVENTSTLCFDDLMDKFEPFVKTNMAELTFLKTLLDPDQCNPEINVTKLANALRQYSESQKTKMDLDESFNLRSGQAPHDSDSGISTDGMQLLEELQCEVKERERLTRHLRSQLDSADRQHEEMTAAMTAERDSLRRHLNILREENATLSHVRRDYDEACERLCSSGAALDEAKRELETLRRAACLSRDKVADLETDIISLQDLLSKSKDECHRINEMYATRQSALLEENETLKSQHAALKSQLLDQDDFMKQVMKEKVRVEKELKDMLNRSNQTQLCMDRSIDVSYTDDQMLTALDSLNADSRFSTENRILEEESFMKALQDDQGRNTNLSLYDEIRMSFNVSRLSISDYNTAYFDKCNLDYWVSIATQTEEFIPCDDVDKHQNSLIIVTVTSATQTDDVKPNDNVNKDENTLKSTTATQTYEIKLTPCKRCCAKNDNCLKVCAGTQTDKLESYREDNKVDVKASMVDFEQQTEIDVNKHSSFKEGKTSDERAQYTDYVNVTMTVDMEIENEASIQNGLSLTENKDQFQDAKDYTDAATQTRKRKFMKKHRTVETQTDEIEPCINNNNAHCIKCFECGITNNYTNKLERDVRFANMAVKEMEATISEYENNLTCLEALIGQEKDRNEKQLALVDDLRSKIDILEGACETQYDVFNKIISIETCCVQSQTEFDVTSVSTQAEMACSECEKRSIVPHRSLRSLFWESLKCLFQVFLVVCFLGAISLLYGVSQRSRVRCDRERVATPWRWFDAQDIMDLLLRIEYTAEVPM